MGPYVVSGNRGLDFDGQVIGQPPQSGDLQPRVFDRSCPSSRLSDLYVQIAKGSLQLSTDGQPADELTPPDQTSSGEELCEYLLGERSGGDSEFFAQYRAQAIVGDECGGDVALGGLGAHEEAVAGFVDRFELDQLASCAFGAPEFGATDAEAGFGVVGEGTLLDQGESVSPFPGPRGVGLGKEAAPGDEGCSKGGGPRTGPLVLGGGGLGVVNRLEGALDVDRCSRWKV